MDRVTFKQKLLNFIIEVGNNIWEARKNGFFPYFVIFLLFTQPLFSQTETEQKQQKVIERKQSSSQSTNHQNNSSNRRDYRWNQNQINYNPYGNRGRWNGREWIIIEHRNPLPPSPPLKVSVGVLSEVTNRKPTIAPYLKMGRTSFMLLQYNFSSNSNVPYYNNINLWEVQQWEDESLGNDWNRTEFSIGFGTKIDNYLSPFVMIGYANQHKYSVYNDETLTLSSDGKYSIDKINESGYTLKLGSFIEIHKTLELLTQLSVGSEVRFGIGIGIKLDK